MTLGATKYIGQRITRREDRRFLSGRTNYVDDIRLPRTVHAAFVRSQQAHAEVFSVRTEPALAHRGVSVDGLPLSPDCVRPLIEAREGKAPR